MLETIHTYMKKKKKGTNVHLYATKKAVSEFKVKREEIKYNRNEFNIFLPA